MPIFRLTKPTSLGHGKQLVCLPYCKKWNNNLSFQQQQKRLLFQRLLQNRSMNYHWMRLHVVYLQSTSRLRYMQTRYKVMLLAAVTECMSILPVWLVSAMCVRYTIENSENCGKKLECHQNNIYVQVAIWVFPNKTVSRPLHTTKIFTKIFLKKSLGKSLSIYKTVEKIIVVVKKSCSVYER